LEQRGARYDARMLYQPDDLKTCALIGAAAAAIAVSFTQGSMFEPLRKWLALRNKLIGELAHCFFCMSHWIVFAGIAIYRPRPLQLSLFADLVVAAFLGVAIATIVSGMMFGAFLLAGHTHVLRERLKPPAPAQRSS
jgi:hypothetical protein